MASRQPNFVLLDSSQAEIARLISCKLVMRSNVDRGRIRKSLRKPPRDRHSPGSPDKRGPPSPSSYGRHRSSKYGRADTSDRKTQLRRAPSSKLLCVRTCFLYGVRASARQPSLFWLAKAMYGAATQSLPNWLNSSRRYAAECRSAYMGSKGRQGPCELAVAGINCAMPAAPFGLTACA